MSLASLGRTGAGGRSRPIHVRMSPVASDAIHLNFYRFLYF
ncbi:hypothetical protein [Scytonema millei]|nr:hypothetical protein [Scytonema millei]